MIAVIEDEKPVADTWRIEDVSAFEVGVRGCWQLMDAAPAEKKAAKISPRLLILPLPSYQR